MSVELHVRVARIALSLAAVLGLQACADRTTEPAANLNAPRPLASSTRLTCVADIRLRTVACSAPKSRANAAAVPIILGGQGTYVQLTADSASYNSGTSQFSANLKVQNLTGQKLGTSDGSDTVGVKVFLNSDPVSSDGSAVVLSNPDGAEVFIASMQPYVLYPEILDAFGGTSRSKPWSFHVASSAQYFTFTVLVSANTPSDVDLPLRWDVERGFATHDSLLVYGIDSRNVFAFGVREDEFGGYTYLADRFDGTGWHSISTDLGVRVKAAWGSSPSDLWVAGTNGISEGATVAHYDGSNWTTTTLAPGTFTGMWGSGPSDVYVVGNANTCCSTAGIAYHYDGTGWTSVGGGFPVFTYAAVTGTASDNVWAIGQNPDFITVVAHFDGSAWSTASPFSMPVEGAAINFKSLYAFGSEVWAVGDGGSAHYSGGAWQVLPDGLSSFIAVHGTDASNVWAVGVSFFSGGIQTEGFTGLSTVLRWDVGTQAWIPAPQPPSIILASLWTSGPNDVWALGSASDIDTDGVPWHWDGTSWSVFGSRLGVVGILDHGAQSLNATFGVDASNVFAVGTSGQILQNTGSGWHQVPGVPETSISWNGVWGSGPNDIWIVGDSGQVRHWNGTALTVSPTTVAPETLVGVYGFAADNVYAVGHGGSILHFDGNTGNTWTVVYPAEYSLNAIWGSDANNIWAVGQGYMFHSNGTTWSYSQANPSGFELFAAGGVMGSPSLVAAGSNGTIIRQTGDTTWAVERGASGEPTLLGLHTDGPSNHMIAVGARGTMLRYTGSAWVPVASGVSSDIRGIWMASSRNIFAVGVGEFIAHGKP